ncbi:MAG: hypothetical protein JNJ45_00460 [Chthonomonas sp.]|nr:hypothetical protein [Chthonomonas sp.]
MHTNHEIDQEAHDEAVRLNYEPRDLSVFVMGKSVLILSLMFVAMVLISYGTIQVLTKLMGIPEPRTHKPELRKELPGGPLIQSGVAAKKDMADLRAGENDKIENYRSNGATGKVSIPLDKALDDVAAQGSIR